MTLRLLILWSTVVTVATLLIRAGHLIRRHAERHEPQHQRRATPPPAPPAAADGRHHADTVETVPPGWSPPIGRRRIDNLTDTRRMELPR